MKKYEAALKEGGVARCWKMFEEEKNGWKDEKVNLAITGGTRTGKSSFINALVSKWTGISPAKVGVTEATMNCTGYEHPNNPNIILWDLPGVGTDKFPQASYLQQVNADLFDVFIIMTGDRFTEQDTWLGKKMQERNTPVVFVRTKIGIDVENSIHDHPDKDEKAVLEEVKRYLMTKSAKFPQSLGVFLIDSHKPDMYEFSDLEECIMEELSASKGQALIFSISRMSRSVVQLKVAELRKEIESAALMLFALGLVSLEQKSIDQKKAEECDKKCEGGYGRYTLNCTVSLSWAVLFIRLAFGRRRYFSRCCGKFSRTDS